MAECEDELDWLEALVFNSVPFKSGSKIYGQNSPKLMLFGGKNNQQYLGCLNCSQYASDSITNEYGIMEASMAA